MVRALAAAALLLAVPAVAQTAAPSPEAEALGRRVAETGTLGTLLPLLVAKDTEELVKQHPELDAAAQAKLRATAGDTARAAIDRVMATVGHQYATRLTIADLQAIVAFNDSAAAKAYRAAEPQVIAATIPAIDGFDLKKEAWTAYCKSPGVICPAAVR